VQDVERGFSDHLWDEPWQTDTCIGDWFYNEARLQDKSYKSAEEVIQRLADVVSKNGNLMLSIPQPGDGSIDSETEKVLDGMAGWMAHCGEAIFGSRPWRIYGEGPTQLIPGMQNEEKAKPFTPQDIRFTTNKGALYALFLGRAQGSTTIRSLARGRVDGAISQVTLLGGGPLSFRQDGAGLHVDMPRTGNFVPAIRIDGRGLI
jgi:alpha-L-fucosidase